MSHATLFFIVLYVIIISSLISKSCAEKDVQNLFLKSKKTAPHQTKGSK